jgi:hypothetical protein
MKTWEFPFIEKPSITQLVEQSIVQWNSEIIVEKTQKKKNMIQDFINMSRVSAVIVIFQ